MKSQKLHKYLALTHKWAGLILGLQVLAWTLGGIVMTWLPINEVRGRHKVAEQPPAVIETAENLLSVSALEEKSGQRFTNITYSTLLGSPIIKTRTSDGTAEIRNAHNGEIISPIDQSLARRIAEADFAPEASVISVQKIEEHIIDYRGPLPVWQVNFSDEENTSLYVSPIEARVVARRSSMWRLFDFFWMLHIMDYEERHDINNPLLMAFALFATLFTISGLWLLFYRFYRRDFNFILGRRKIND